jgi:tetratricopeptide (TPR) repeat protein
MGLTVLSALFACFSTLAASAGSEFSWQKDPNYNTDPAATFTKRGDSFAADWDDEKAIASYTSALKANPKFSPALLNRGRAYKDLQKWPEAFADFNAVDKADKLYWFIAVREKAELNLFLHKYKEAVEDSTTYLGVNGKADGVYQVRANAYLGMGKLDLAIKDFDTSVKLRPGAVHPYKARAQAYFQAKRYKEALADINKILSMDASGDQSITNNSDLLKMRQQIYDILGKHEQARDQQQLIHEHEAANVDAAPFRSRRK